MKRLMGTALLLCLLASSAHAQTASESFDYHAGADLNALNGGTGWATPWNAPGAKVILDPKTPFLGKLVVSGKAVGLFANPTQFLTADRTTSFTFGSPGTTQWFSFLITRVHFNPAGITPPAYGGLSFGANPGLFVGDLGNGHWGMDNSGKSLSGFVNASRVAQNAPTFLVVQADFHRGADKFTLYQNPTPGLAEPDIPGLVKQDIEISQSNLIQLAYGNGNAYVVDEIRLGSTYAEVAPGLTPAVPTPVETPAAVTDLAPRQAVEAAYRDLDRAMNRKDTEALLAQETNSFVRLDVAGAEVHQTAQSLRKELNTLFAANAKLRNVTVVDEVTLESDDAAATVTAHCSLTLRPKSSPGVRIDSTVRDHWTREDGTWHLDQRQILTTKRTKISVSARKGARRR